MVKKTFVEDEKFIVLKQERLINGLKLVAVVGIGAGLYGFKLGRKSGIRTGVKEGYIAASNEFILALREHHEDLKKVVKKSQ